MDKKNLPINSIRLYSGTNYDLNKRWYIAYKDENGKRKKIYGNLHQYPTKIARQQAAEQLIKQLQLDLHKNYISEKEKTAHAWLDDMKPTWRKKTYQCKKSRVSDFLNYMKDIEWNTENIRRYFVDYLSKKKKLMPSTWNDYRGTIRQLLNVMGLGYTMEFIPKRFATPTPARYFSNSEKAYLINEIEKYNKGLHVYVQLVYYCFLRPRSEIRFLKIGNVLIEEKKILIPTHIGKNKKHEFVAIPDVFYPTVAEFVKGKNPMEFLFPGDGEGGVMGHNTFGRMHRNLLKKLRFDTTQYKVYSWKHTGAVAAVMAGVHIKQLQIQLRHSSLDQVDEYLRQLGLHDLGDLMKIFPAIAPPSVDDIEYQKQKRLEELQELLKKSSIEKIDDYLLQVNPLVLEQILRLYPKQSD